MKRYQLKIQTNVSRLRIVRRLGLKTEGVLANFHSTLLHTNHTKIQKCDSSSLGFSSSINKFVRIRSYSSTNSKGFVFKPNHIGYMGALYGTDQNRSVWRFFLRLNSFEFAFIRLDSVRNRQTLEHSTLSSPPCWKTSGNRLKIGGNSK